MKTPSVRPPTRTLLSLAALALLITGAVLYAGPIDPPAGPVTSTGKTLSEIRPGIAINAANTPGDADSKFKITQPGSYYFTGNIIGDTGTHGIEISLGPAGGHVSIDMGGFTLRGVPGSLNGFECATLPSSIVSWDIHDGIVEEYPEWTFRASGSGRIANVRMNSAGLGCINLVGGGNRTTTIENCTLRSTGGMGLISEVAMPVVIRHTVIEGEDCNTTSLISLGGPTTADGLTVRTRNSVFGGPVIEVGPDAILGTTYGGNGQLVCSGVTATSALRISPGTGAALGAGLMEDWADDFFMCTFTTALIEVGRDGAQLRNVSVRADDTTSAPVGLRVAASNCLWDDDWLFRASVPIAMDVIGSNNTFSGGSIMTAGTGIRLTGASNTVTGCRISGTGASSFIGVQIPSGSLNNLIIKNEFVNVGAGTAVSNLGGPTNGVAPIVTPGNLNAAVNPFSNIQH